MPMSGLNYSTFAKLLFSKLEIEQRYQTVETTHIAREVCEMLRHMRNVADQEDDIEIGHLAYGKVIVHNLLLCHGFTLVSTAPFNALDDAELELLYKSCYRDDYDYRVNFVLGNGYVTITLTRSLTAPPVNNGVVENPAVSVATNVSVKPTFEIEARLQDYFKTEKVLINMTKIFSKLWTSFRNTSEPPTPVEPADFQMLDQSVTGPAGAFGPALS